MSEKWAGFTEEDIERIKLNPESCADKKMEMEGYPSTSKNRGPMKIKNITPKSEKKEYAEDCIKYSQVDPMDVRKLEPHENVSAMESSKSDEENCTCENYVFEENHNAGNFTNTYEESNSKCDAMRECEANLLPLDVFEMRQRHVEAENARRRALISKAINDKKKRTHAEAVKLAKITQELNHIDSNLSADVSILRNYIERASLEFSEAEKRYLKAEKEFVESKLLLFEKMQRKEMLTEHLCAIIEQNENRKADKLVELMRQLEMEVVLEHSETNGITTPILSNLCTLNDERYHTCHTLKPGSSSSSSLDKSTSEISQPSEGEEKRSSHLTPDQTPNVASDSNNLSGELER